MMLPSALVPSTGLLPAFGLPRASSEGAIPNRGGRLSDPGLSTRAGHRSNSGDRERFSEPCQPSWRAGEHHSNGPLAEADPFQTGDLRSHGEHGGLMPMDRSVLEEAEGRLAAELALDTSFSHMSASSMAEINDAVLQAFMIKAEARIAEGQTETAALRCITNNLQVEVKLLKDEARELRQQLVEVSREGEELWQREVRARTEAYAKIEDALKRTFSVASPSAEAAFQAGAAFGGAAHESRSTASRQYSPIPEDGVHCEANSAFPRQASAVPNVECSLEVDVACNGAAREAKSALPSGVHNIECSPEAAVRPPLESKSPIPNGFRSASPAAACRSSPDTRLSASPNVKAASPLVGTPLGPSLLQAPIASPPVPMSPGHPGLLPVEGSVRELLDCGECSPKPPSLSATPSMSHRILPKPGPVNPHPPIIDEISPPANPKAGAQALSMRRTIGCTRQAPTKTAGVSRQAMTPASTGASPSAASPNAASPNRMEASNGYSPRRMSLGVKVPPVPQSLTGGSLTLGSPQRSPLASGARKMVTPQSPLRHAPGINTSPSGQLPR